MSVPRTPANEHERESARKSALNDRRRAVSDMIRTAAGMGFVHAVTMRPPVSDALGCRANGVVGLRFAQNRLEGYHSEVSSRQLMSPGRCSYERLADHGVWHGG